MESVTDGILSLGKRAVGRLPAGIRWEVMAALDLNVPQVATDKDRAEGREEAKGIVDRADEFQESFDAESATVLEIGCGYGRLLVPTASLVDEAYGTDISRSSLRRTRQYAEEEGVNVTLAKAEETIPFDKEFDLIYALRVFTHLPRRQVIRYLKTIKDHLAADGVLLFRVPSLEQGGMDDLLAGELHHDYSFRVRYYTKSELETYMDGVGFSTMKIDGGWYVQASPE